ncbi:MAG: hypothetical protein HOQ35_04285 [Acidobacteriaceae bacterium]|nr:hypothetical protein [Acidobacteriaceae bacterium]
MNTEELLELPPEIEAELQAITDLMFERQVSTQAAINAHSQAWKDLERHRSQEAAEALLRAEAAMVSAGEALNAASRMFDEFLLRHGIDPDTLEKKLPSQKNRLWQKDLEPATVPKDSVDIETALQQNLEQLLDLFPPAWIERQLVKAMAIMRGRTATPPFLLGHLSADPVIEDRFSYGLALAVALLVETPHFDIYEAPSLVPQIAMLCMMLPALEKVDGGIEKLLELRKAPGREVDSRIYELLVAAGAADMGRKVSFIPTHPGSKTPDLRVHDMHFPVVMECKLQSRQSEVENQTVALMRPIRDWFQIERQKGNPILGELRLSLTSRVGSLDAAVICEDLRQLWSSLNPFQRGSYAWGSAEWLPLPVEMKLSTTMRAFCPAYLEELMPDATETGSEWDGLFFLVEGQFGPTANSIKMPLCVRWRLEHPDDMSAVARNVVRHLGEAIEQIPHGEVGIIYIGYVDTLRVALADQRTEGIIDALPEFGHTKRGVLAPMAEINRLYPHVSEYGAPDLIESAIPATQDAERALHRYFPTLVFTAGDGADLDDAEIQS